MVIRPTRSGIPRPLPQERPRSDERVQLLERIVFGRLREFFPGQQPEPQSKSNKSNKRPRLDENFVSLITLSRDRYAQDYPDSPFPSKTLAILYVRKAAQLLHMQQGIIQRSVRAAHQLPCNGSEMQNHCERVVEEVCQISAVDLEEESLDKKSVESIVAESFNEAYTQLKETDCRLEFERSRIRA